MAMSGANYTKHFTNLGKHIDIYNQVETWRTALDTAEGEAAALMKDDRDEIDALSILLAKTKNIDAALISAKAQVVSAVRDYVKNSIAGGIGYTGSSSSIIDILESLAEDMVEAAESVDGSAVAATAPTYDAQNSGTGSLAALSSISQLCTDEFWELECTSVSGGAGAEEWQVRGEPDRHGQLTTALTTGVAYNAIDSNGQALFTTTLTAYTAGTGYEITGDTHGELGATAFTGALKGTNTDSAGDVFAVIDQKADGESGDNNNQLSDWTNITGIVLLKNVDVDGRLHASIVDDGGGFFHVDFYSEVGRTGLVGHTASYNAGGAQAIVEDNGSGLGGTITIDAATAVDVDIYYGYTIDRVRFYKEVGLSNLVAAGGLNGGGSTTLYAQNASGLTGTAVIAYTDGEANIQVRIGFAFAVGDKIYLTTTNDEAGIFAEFFREALGVAPAVDIVGGETQADTLAQ